MHVITFQHDNLAGELEMSVDGNTLLGHFSLYNPDIPDENLYEKELSINLQPLQTEALNQLNGRVGWSWKSAVRAAKKIAKHTAAGKMLSAVNKIVKDPRFAKGMRLASAIYPPLGISYSAVRKSANLIAQVRKGIPGAQKKLASIALAAREGNAAAQHLSKVLLVMNQASKAGHDVVGWSENLAYRC